jgi:hypothetical protein
MWIIISLGHNIPHFYMQQFCIAGVEKAMGGGDLMAYKYIIHD